MTKLSAGFATGKIDLVGSFITIWRQCLSSVITDRKIAYFVFLHIFPLSNLKYLL